MIAGISHSEFWDLTPDEIAMSIDAYITRQDSEFLRTAIIASTIANANRHRGKLYTPHDFMPRQRRNQAPNEQLKVLQKFARRSAGTND